MKTEKTLNSQGINLPGFRLYSKFVVIKTIWYWHKNRNTDQWNKIESPEMNPHTYGYLSFDKRLKTMPYGDLGAKELMLLGCGAGEDFNEEERI